jgi:hypothetical protein
MPLTIEDIFRRLCAVLLRGPRDPHGADSAVFRMCEDIFGQFGRPMHHSPVTGVAMSAGENEPLITLLLDKDIQGFADYVAKSLELDLRINQLAIGQVFPSSRPVAGGESLGQGISGWESGTFGCAVANAANERFLLSCHHVLTRVNSGLAGRDAVWQPSKKDGGGSGDKIGVLHAVAPIVFGGTQANEIDAALAKPDDPAALAAGIKGIGPIAGTATSVPYKMPVKKYGWRTRQTTGTYLYRVNYIQAYKDWGDALFENQLGIFGTREAVFSEDGDSGALVVNQKNEAVGLIFATAPDAKLTFANPIQKVFDFFGVVPV